MIMILLKRSSGFHLLLQGTTLLLVLMEKNFPKRGNASRRQGEWTFRRESGPRLAWLVSVGREKKRSFLYSSSQHQPLRSPDAHLLESGQIMSFEDLKLELWGI